LIEIAFILKAPAHEKVEKRRTELLTYIEEKKKGNEAFVTGQYASEKEKFQKFEDMANEKEKLWRKLKHSEALAEFKHTI